MRMPLTIIIPAKHEEETILATLHQIKEKVKTPHKIIVVNDSDRLDKTHTIVRNYMKENASVSMIVKRKTHNNGTFSSALKAGFDAVDTGVVIPVMADMCDLPETIDEMYKIIQKGWDIVCGSRYMKGGVKIGGPKLQNFLSWVVCQSMYYISGVPTHDVSNSFKMYRTDILKKVDIDTSRGVEISMDITLQLYYKGATITEIPTTWVGRTKGVSKFHLVERAPRYLNIYFWVLYKTIRRVVSAPVPFIYTL